MYWFLVFSKETDNSSPPPLPHVVTGHDPTLRNGPEMDTCVCYTTEAHIRP